MSEHLKHTIADLQSKLAEQEEAVITTKTLINQLAEMAGMPPVYSDAELQVANTSNLSIRSDQFYGQPQATCVREILEMRRSLNQGPATVNEIFEAMKEGGFAFDTKNDENAKRGLRISISKNTALFHKLPNGRIGLLAWYPKAKQPKNGTNDSTADNGDHGDHEEEEANED